MIVYKLKMARPMKIALYSVFLLGLVDISFSLTRFLTIQLGNEGDFRAITLIGKSMSHRRLNTLLMHLTQTL